MKSLSDMARPEGRGERDIAGFLLDVSFAALLTGMLIFSALKFEPAISSGPRQHTGSILIAVLTPIVSLLSLSLLERLTPPAGPRKSIRRWLLHLQINIFVLFMLGLVGALFATVPSALARHFGINLGLIDLRFAGEKGLWSALGAIWVSNAIVSDFFFYWLHRAQHKFPFLWQHHKMHHMDRELDAVTYARQNWLEAFLIVFLIIVPGSILFKTDTIDPWTLGVTGGIVSVIFVILLQMEHANLRIQTGRASVLWCTPQVHRIHHSRLPHHRDKNFASLFPLWDVLFGTYYAPARDEFPPTGVDGETEIQSFWESLVFTPREWWRMYRAWLHRPA
jgi:sterol desaturase/sphingolipid hydroxylase (fatty acid hydroxylase superfamily)